MLCIWGFHTRRPCPPLLPRSLSSLSLSPCSFPALAPGVYYYFCSPGPFCHRTTLAPTHPPPRIALSALVLRVRFPLAPSTCCCFLPLVGFRGFWCVHDDLLVLLPLLRSLRYRHVRLGGLTLWCLVAPRTFFPGIAIAGVGCFTVGGLPALTSELLFHLYNRICCPASDLLLRFGTLSLGLAFLGLFGQSPWPCRCFRVIAPAVGPLVPFLSVGISPVLSEASPVGGLFAPRVYLTPGRPRFIPVLRVVQGLLTRWWCRRHPIHRFVPYSALISCASPGISLCSSTQYLDPWISQPPFTSYAPLPYSCLPLYRFFPHGPSVAWACTRPEIVSEL